jgi:tripartite-type tricarboxylate transporter receptor subunit TctC
MRIFTAVIIFSVLCLFTRPILSADYPSKNVQVLVGFPAGGSADAISRLVINKISEVTNKTFIVENRTGAGGNIAFSNVASAKADGYTLLFSTPGIAINPSLYKRVNYKIEDFTPLAIVGEAPLMLLINAELPYKTVADLVSASRHHSDAIRFASAGNGSSSHLAMDVLRAMSGMKYLHIPYRGGGGPAIIDVMSGQVDMTMLPISGGNMRYIRDTKLRPIGQTGSKRSSLALDIPTISESGIKGYTSTTWYMLLAPASLPKPIAQYLEKQTAIAVRSADLQEKLQANGVSIINGGAEDAEALLKLEFKNWARLIRESGTVVD